MKTKFWIGLSAIEQIDSTFFFALYEHFGDIEKVFNASLNDLRQIEGLSIRKVDNFLTKRDKVDPDKAYQEVVSRGIKFLTFEDEDYLSRQNNMVAVTEIPIFSYCEHHMALMYNMTVSVAYLPKEKIIGLSKIARIADMVGRRLQLQERIGSDIAEIVSMVTESDDVAVLVKGEHSCMTARGIKKAGTVTRTATFRGIFEEDINLRQEALLLLGQQS